MKEGALRGFALLLAGTMAGCVWCCPRDLCRRGSRSVRCVVAGADEGVTGVGNDESTRIGRRVTNVDSHTVVIVGICDAVQVEIRTQSLAQVS